MQEDLLEVKIFQKFLGRGSFFLQHPVYTLCVQFDIGLAGLF